jgi:hypothetical protein
MIGILESTVVDSEIPFTCRGTYVASTRSETVDAAGLPGVTVNHSLSLSAFYIARIYHGRRR